MKCDVHLSVLSATSIYLITIRTMSDQIDVLLYGLGA